MSARGWDVEWAAEKSSAAMRYLVDSYPECSASPKLHPHQDAAHEEAYLDALRSFMRPGETRPRG
jgi:hypothetical protein